MAALRDDPFDPVRRAGLNRGDLQGMGIHVRKVSSFGGTMVQVNGGNPYRPAPPTRQSNSENQSNSLRTTAFDEDDELGISGISS